MTKPLIDDDAADNLLRTALRGARKDLPDASWLEPMAQSIAKATGAGGGGGGGGGSGREGTNGTPVASSVGMKLAALGGAAVVVSAAVVLVTRPRADVVAPPAATSVVASPAAVEPSASPIETAEAPLAIDVHSLPAAPSASTSPHKPVGSSRPVNSPEGEMAVLRGAQDALARSPAEALARCEEHAARYPAGSLAEEREVLAVDALVRLGRRGEAEERAARFRRRYPESAYRARLETLLSRP